MDTSELKQLIEEQGRLWNEFRAKNDDRLSKVEKGLSATDYAAQLEALGTRIDEITALRKEVGDLKAKAERPAAGDEADKAEKTRQVGVFKEFLRRGTGEMVQKALSVGTAADGGYAVPELIERTIQQRLIDISPIRSIATVQPVGTPDYKRLISKRGAASGWVGETAARTTTNTPTLHEAVAFMGEIYANPKATQQVLDDVFFNAEAWLDSEVRDEFAYQEGAAFVSGNGTNKPKGFLAYTFASTDDGARTFGEFQYVPTGVAGDWAATNKGDVLVTLTYKLKAGHRQNARWVLSKALLGEIRAFKNGDGDYIWKPGLEMGQPQSLLGYPITEAEDMPAKAANSLSVAFGDFRRGYCVVDRPGTLRMLRDPYTDKPNIQFYTTMRVGGMALDSDAIKAIKFAVS